MRIACLQFRPVRAEPRSNVENLVSLLEDIEADLVVLPELATTGYLFPDRAALVTLAEPVPGPTTEAIGKVCASRDMHVVCGLAERDGDRIHNSAVLVGPEGVVGLYRKTHLFLDEKDLFAPGDTGFGVFDVRGVGVGMLVCFDWIFPESARSLALAGAQVIAHPANLVLPWAQDAAITRCLENRVFWVLANRTGVETVGESSLAFTGRSRIVSPRGEVLVQASVEDETAITTRVDPMEALDKHVNPRNDLLADRRPQHYR